MASNSSRSRPRARLSRADSAQGSASRTDAGLPASPFPIALNGTIADVHFGQSLKFSDAGAFRQLLRALDECGQHVCRFDISSLAAIDSAGLGMFILAQEAAEKGGWSLVLKGAHGHVQTLINLSRLDQLIAIEP